MNKCWSDVKPSGSGLTLALIIRVLSLALGGLADSLGCLVRIDPICGLSFGRTPIAHSPEGAAFWAVHQSGAIWAKSLVVVADAP